jgi:hypothetical protein
MKFHQIALTCAALLISLQISGQVSIQPQHYSVAISNQTLDPKLVEVIDGIATVHYSLNSSPLNGSPYLTDEFVPGTMETLNGAVIEGMKYRYNIYNDEMQFIIGTDTASINKPLAVRSIEMDHKKFVYEVYRVSEQMVAAGYFELLSEGDMSLLFRRQMELEYDNYVPNYGGGGGTKEFMLKNDNHFYVKLHDGAAQKVYNRKDFLEAIPPDLQERVKQFIKENKFSVRKQEDLMALVVYYNSLY